MGPLIVSWKVACVDGGVIRVVAVVSVGVEIVVVEHVVAQVLWFHMCDLLFGRLLM